MNNFSGVADLLQALVRIPSVNPADDPGTDLVGESACAEFVGNLLTSLGAEVTLPEVEPGRPNVIGRFPTSAPGKPKLLLAPHTDTVSVLGMTVPPFAAEVRDGKIYGRGASDTKGTMAAMLMALNEIKDEIPNLGHEIWFAGLMGEEAGQHGACALVKDMRPDFVLIGEPTELGIVHTHKGCIWLKITTSGKAVHASLPNEGDNAIYKMAAIIDYFSNELAGEFSAIHDATLGSPTLNVGTISGGSKTNIVPDACHCSVDIRTTPGQDTDALTTAIREHIESIAPSSLVEAWSAKPLFTDPDHPLIDRLRNAGGFLTGAPWFCDGAVFGEAGIPAVAAGPGSIRQAHTVDEWVSIEDLKRGVDFYRDFLRQC